MGPQPDRVGRPMSRRRVGRLTGVSEEREGPHVRGERGVDLRALRLPPGMVRHTVMIEAGGSLCAEGAASCGEIIEVDDGAIDVVVPSGERQRLEAGALLFVAGLRDVELRCVGPAPAVLTGIRRVPLPDP